MAISSVDRIRLAALLGMLGSSHTGERENAARLVEQFRRQRGVNWSDVLTRHSYGDRPADASPDAAPQPESWPLSRTERIQDLVWRWSMLLGLAAVGLMSLTSLAEHHAAENPPAARCQGSACAASALAAAGATMPAAYLQGQADRRVFETWRQTAPAGLCSARGAVEHKALAPDCAIARKLLAQFDQRLEGDIVYRAGWNSLPPGGSGATHSHQ
jgi:hypothetical protein